CQHHNPYPWTF
nr:immunoglobulin light chain junction region [Macaca mulatta]